MLSYRYTQFKYMIFDILTCTNEFKHSKYFWSLRYSGFYDISSKEICHSFEIRGEHAHNVKRTWVRNSSERIKLFFWRAWLHSCLRGELSLSQKDNEAFSFCSGNFKGHHAPSILTPTDYSSLMSVEYSVVELFHDCHHISRSLRMYVFEILHI